MFRFFPFFLLFLFSSCYQEVEGCLDVNATNYDLDADNACPNNGCCTYPDIGVTVTHRRNGETVRLDTIYRDGFGNEYRLDRLRYYWSELVLDRSGTDPLVPVDTILAGLSGGSGDTLFQTLDGNLVLVGTGDDERLTFGTITGLENANALSGLLGLRGDYQDILPATMPEGSPLAFQAGRLYYGRDTGYVQMKLEYSLIVGQDTTARAVEVFGHQPFALPFGDDLALPRGFNLNVFIDAELEILLDGVDLSAPAADLRNRLETNLPFMFTLTAITGEN